MAKLKGSVGPMSMVALLREVRKAERDSKPLASLCRFSRASCAWAETRLRSSSKKRPTPQR
jgi:hypothetical protein